MLAPFLVLGQISEQPKEGFIGSQFEGKHFEEGVMVRELRQLAMACL